MIRVRFRANESDPRPILWPIKNPYWITGYGDGYAIVVAYAESEDEIFENWPEASNLDCTEVNEYSFSDRFPRPEWL